MRTFIFMVLITLFFGCATTNNNKCVNVVYLHTTEKELFEKPVYFKGTVKENKFAEYSGMVIDTVPVFQRYDCPDYNTADLPPGFYAVSIKDPYSGVWVLDGKGYGDSVTITPNKIRQKSVDKFRETNWRIIYEFDSLFP
jgi:hypothetical protein